MEINWLFDVDGTLTPARLAIDSEFKKFFLKWMEGRNVYLVTGSDYPKTLEQLGPEIVENVSKVYASMGNSVWQSGKNVKDHTWKPSESLYQLLHQLLEQSTYPIRTSNHIEDRPGMINFSVIGRDCTQEQREEYYRWDQASGERKKIQTVVETEFPELSVQIGGQISLDIIPKGKDKAQVVNELMGQCIFFGDHIHPGGNDMSLAEELLLRKSGHIIAHTTGWQDTYAKLTHLYK